MSVAPDLFPPGAMAPAAVAPKTIARPDGPQDHRCFCGKFGSFGYGGPMWRGRAYVWRCGDHRVKSQAEVDSQSQAEREGLV